DLDHAGTPWQSAYGRAYHRPDLRCSFSPVTPAVSSAASCQCSLRRTASDVSRLALRPVTAAIFAAARQHRATRSVAGHRPPSADRASASSIVPPTWVASSGASRLLWRTVRRRTTWRLWWTWARRRSRGRERTISGGESLTADTRGSDGRHLSGMVCRGNSGLRSGRGSKPCRAIV